MPQEVIIVVHLLNPGDLDRMHKLNLNKKKVNKLEISDIKLLTIIEMGFFSKLKKTRTRVNPRPFSKPPQIIQQTPIVKKEKPVDLHLEIVKKVDELIAQNETETKTNETEPVTKIQDSKLLTSNLVTNESPTKVEKTPIFRAEIDFPKALGDLAHRQEFYEIDQSSLVTPKIEKEKEEDITSRMVGNEDKKVQKTAKAIGKIKVKPKGKETKKLPKKNNSVTKTKKELEKSKAEIESKKKELEEAIEREKQKELELKRKEVEKRKREKLKEIELKKKMKEQKQREKEKERELELKRKEEEKLKKQQLKEEEKRKKEKLKEQELKKKIKEQEQKEKLKEKKVEKPEKKEEDKPKEKKVEKPEKKEKQEKPKEKKIKIFKKEKEPEPLDRFIKEERPTETEPKISEWDEDVEKLLPILDDLFDKLPEDVIDEFARSEDFQLYEKVVLKYKNK